MTGRREPFYQSLCMCLSEFSSGRAQPSLLTRTNCHLKCAPPNVAMEHPTPPLDQEIPNNDTQAVGRDRFNLRVSQHTPSPRVHFIQDTAGNRDSRFLRAQRRRVQEFQQRWEIIKTDLPPQLSRRHSERASILVYYILFLTLLYSRQNFDRSAIIRQCHCWRQQYEFLTG